jgi:hypothetical protein
VQKVLSWADAVLKPDPASEYRRTAKLADEGKAEFAKETPLTRAKVYATAERALWIRQQRLIAAGKFHSVEDCEKRILRQSHEIKSRLLALPRSLSKRIVGETIESIEATLVQELTSVCEALSHG